MHFSPRLKRLLILLIVVGVVFRFVNLNHKLYWHDEVYTSLRAAGYTRQEIDQSLFQNQVVSIADLQRFQQLKPDSHWTDTVRSLATEDPQHPPLYFLLARSWLHWFGSVPLAVPRSLAVLLSLGAIPAMYALAWELFASAAVALMAATLMALSPFDVLFAQVARQYSLLTVMVIVSHWLLLRALRRTQTERNQWLDWAGYQWAIAIGLYTHPFFGLAIVAQAVYVGVLALLRLPQGIKGWLPFSVFSIAALGLYAPWLYVLATNAKRAFATTNWSEIAPGLGYLAKLWTLSFTALFLDLDFGFDNPLTVWLRVPILLLLGVAIYLIGRRCDRAVWLWIVIAIAVPFLLLALPDLIFGGKRSAVSRYLIPCYPAVQLAIAYLITMLLVRGPQPAQQQRRDRLLKTIGQGSLALLIVASLSSLIASAAAFTWWHNDLSHFNNQVAQSIQATNQPIIISDIGDDYTNTGDLISLSYLLNPSVRLLPIQQPTWVNTAAFQAQIKGDRVFVFRPSQLLKQALEQRYGALQRVMLEERLWQISPRAIAATRKVAAP